MSTITTNSALNGHIINSQSEIYPRLTRIYIRSILISVNNYSSTYNSVMIRRSGLVACFGREDALGGEETFFAMILRLDEWQNPKHT